MTQWERPVFSEMAQAVGYDDETQDLIVTWKNGRKSAYSGVPEEVALELSNAPSVGSMINNEIKNQYPHRYVA